MSSTAESMSSTSVMTTDNVTSNSSTLNPTTLRPAPPEIPVWFDQYLEYNMAVYINKYYLFVICAIGTPGNIASFVTLVQIKPLMTSSIYMMVLAFIDTVALLLKLLYHQLTSYDISISTRGCACLFYFGTFTQHYANWILVAMTIERFIAIWFPLKVGKLCTKRNTVVTLIGLAVSIALLNIQFLFTFEEVSDPFLIYDCRPKQEHMDFISNVWYWIDGAFYAIIPCILLFLFNGMIVFGIQRSNRLQKDLTNRMENMSEKLRQQRQITVMLITVSVMFVLLTMPNCIFFIVKEKWNWQESMHATAQYYLTYQIVFVLSDSNHAINFYLYCLSGRKFREKFKQTMLCRRRRLRQNPKSYYSNLASMRTRTMSVSNVSPSHTAVSMVTATPNGSTDNLKSQNGTFNSHM